MISNAGFAEFPRNERGEAMGFIRRQTAGLKQLLLKPLVKISQARPFVSGSRLVGFVFRYRGIHASK